MDSSKEKLKRIKIIPLSENHILSVSRMHRVSISNTTPSLLGEKFLAQMYRVLIVDANSICLVAENQNHRLFGAVTATRNLPKTLQNQKKIFYKLPVITRLFKMVFTRKINPLDIWNRMCFEKYLIGILKSDSSTILTLFVDSKYRGQGIGRQLMQSVLSCLKKSSVSVFVDTRENNINAIDFYRDIGFTQIDRCFGNVILKLKN
jgi:ribosomal protein S18 acetylase RimI-like enzyme